MSLDRLAYETIKQELSAVSQVQTRPQLLAVSKGQPASKIAELYDLGQRHFGENYAAEMVTKRAELQERCPELVWHYIGRIQKRQAKDIRHAQWVHSVGSLKEAQYLVRGMPEGELGATVLLQVNIGEEPQKGGFLPKQLLETPLNAFVDLKVRVSGLMCIPPVDHLQAETNGFEATFRLREELQARWGQELPELSMGMTGDYRDALKAGATWIRVGTKIFGPRNK